MRPRPCVNATPSLVTLECQVWNAKGDHSTYNDGKVQPQKSQAMSRWKDPKHDTKRWSSLTILSIPHDKPQITYELVRHHALCLSSGHLMTQSSRLQIVYAHVHTNTIGAIWSAKTKLLDSASPPSRYQHLIVTHLAPTFLSPPEYVLLIFTLATFKAASTSCIFMKH